ncbi:MAG: DNA repair and recombination protein RadB [Candidatus Nanohaloarchaea archaeon]
MLYVSSEHFRDIVTSWFGRFIWIFIHVRKKFCRGGWMDKRFRNGFRAVEVERIATGCESIDSLLKGGIEKGIITNVFGGSGSGKTNFCIQLAARMTSQGEKVAFIDTEGGFSPERFMQLADEEALDNLLVRDPVDFEQQQEAIEELSDVVQEQDVKMIVVDSMVSLYRLKVNGDNVSEINQQLSEQLSELSRLARTHDIPVMITNQVYTSFDEEGTELVGRDVPRYWSKCLLELSEDDSNVRKLRVEKHRSMPEDRTTRFQITDDGLESPDEKGLF